MCLQTLLEQVRDLHRRTDAITREKVRLTRTFGRA